MKIKLDPLDKLLTRYLRLKTNNTCEYCGRVGYVETSHFHSRRKWITRLDEDNVAALCRECHRRFEEHHNLHCDFFKRKLGSDKYEALNARSEIVKKRTKEDVEAIKTNLKEKIRIYEEVSDNIC